MEPVSRRIPPIILLAAVCLPVLVFAFPGLNPSILFGAVICAFALLAAALYWPAAFLVVPAFAPQFKTLPGFRSIQDHVDLTLLALCGAALVILLHSIFGSPRAKLDPGRFTGSSRQITAFFFFAMVVAASYLYTPSPHYGGVKLIRLLLIGGFFLLAPLYLINSEEDFRHFGFTFVILGILQSFALFLRADRVSASPEDVDVTRIGAGWAIGMAILLLLFYPVVESPFWRKSLRLLALPCLIAGLIASASRGAVFATALASLFLFLKAYKGRNKVLMLFTGATIGLFVVGVAFYFLRGMGNGKYTDKVSEIVSMAEGHQTEGSAGKRLAFYSAALREIPQRPLIGLGVGGWSAYYYGKDERDYPHNIILEIATEEGLVGVFAFSVFLIAIYRASRELSSFTGTHFTVLTGLLLFTILATMFSGDLDDDRMIWLWSGMILAVLHFARVQLAELSFQQRLVFWAHQPPNTAEAAR
jgi:O-antigen ligase